MELLRKGPDHAHTGTEGVNPILVITEGERDFAVMAHESMEKPHIAVMGITSGAWDTSLASRIPGRWTVEIRTDHDPTGNAYAKTIHQSLPNHEVTRG